MPSLEVREFAEKINQLSLEDKQWLLQQLMQYITISNNSELNPSNSGTNEVKKTFNITPILIQRLIFFISPNRYKIKNQTKYSQKYKM